MLAAAVPAAASSLAGGSAASAFSNTQCAASGATANKEFSPGGAVANSGTDSTAAIQNAINTASAAGGGFVPLTAGTYTLDGYLLMKSNVKLIGVGSTTILKAGPGFLDKIGPNGGYPVVTTVGASNVTIKNLTADQSGNVLNGNANPSTRLAGYLIDIRDSRNAVVSGVYTRNPFTYSIAVVGSSDFCVTGSNTQEATSGKYNQLDGIHILDSNTGQVIGNHVDQRIGTDGDDGLVAHSMAGPVYDVLYANNSVRGGNNGDGMQFAVGDYPIHDITVRDNDFYGSPYGIRTGYYDTDSNGAVYNILIIGNYIHNLVPGNAFPDGGNAVDMGGFGAIGPVTYVTVTQNDIFKAGVIIVVSGTGNSAYDNDTL
jgi:polygalacturonase